MAFNGSLAVLLASKYCKQCPLFQWREEALYDMGRRAEKYCFVVDMLNLRQDKCGEMLLSLFPMQHSFLDFQKDNTIYKLKALLVTLKHPYVLPVLDVHFSKEKKGLLVVQPFVGCGSLKDRIHRARPTQSYKAKYRLHHASPLPRGETARYGRQLLEAIRDLRSRGIVCEHLSSGNVMVEQGVAKISDLYATLLAVDRHRDVRELTVPLEAHVDIDLLLFGHVVYEMATGMELLTPAPDESVLEFLHPDIAHVLRMIFDPSIYANAVNAMDDSSVDGDAATTSMLAEDESSSSSSDNGSINPASASKSDRLDAAALLKCPLFQQAQVQPIDTLFAGFCLDSSMKSTIRNSMRINASRNQAHMLQYSEQQALLRAKQRAERRVHEEKDRAQQRIQQSNRGQLMRKQSSGLTRRKSLRADMQLRRQASSNSSYGAPASA